MKTTSRISKNTIAECRKHRDDLKRVINNLIVNDHPLHVDDNLLSHPTQVKRHLLFDGNLDEQIDTWEIITSAGEKNTDTTHARDNRY